MLNSSFFNQGQTTKIIQKSEIELKFFLQMLVWAEVKNVEMELGFRKFALFIFYIKTIF